MDRIEKMLEPLDGYLISITRNTEVGWYELEVGIPAKWAIAGNQFVACEIVSDDENGKIVILAPAKSDVGLGTLVDFMKLLINTNKKIAEKEALFAKKMENFKSTFENKANQFYKELDDMRETSFKPIVDDTKSEPKSNTKA